MENLPLVSVITPSFNQGRFIEDTIQSVLGQDYPHIEYLVIDGGSTDETLDVLRKYENKLSWVSEPDRGQTDAINKGFRKARGEIICWLNSDDTYEPGAISKAVQFFCDNPEVSMIYGDGNEIDEAGNFLHRFHATQKFDLWALIHVWDYILQPTTFFKKGAVKALSYLNEEHHWTMDWDLWIRIGSQYRVEYVGYVFANSRIYADTKTGSGGIKRWREIVDLQRRYGRKKYPLGFFLYGIDTLDTAVRTKFPKSHGVFSRLFIAGRQLLGRIQRNYQGSFQDGWIGPKASLLLSVPESCENLMVEFEVPDMKSLLPNTVHFSLNGQLIAKMELIAAGKQTLTMPVVGHRGLVELTIRTNNSFRPHGDFRSLALRNFTFFYGR
jgi:glycosyltransferase involved in cell wall biosynthesis